MREILFRPRRSYSRVMAEPVELCPHVVPRRLEMRAEEGESMQFRLPEEHELIRSSVRRFTEEVLAERARERDEQARFERTLFGKLGEMGLAGIVVPERLGGGGGGALSFAVALEELARVCASTAAALAAHTAFCLWPMYLGCGSDLARQELLIDLASGRKLGGCALANRDDIQLAWIKTGAGYALSGRHRSAVNAPAADVYVVQAKNEAGGKSGLFVLPADRPGLTLAAPEKKLGLRSLPSAGLVADACKLAPKERLGKAGQAPELLRSMALLGDIAAAAQSVGLAQAALGQATDYASKRIQFGEPIGGKQGIAFKLADMTAQVEASRLLLYQAAWRMEQNRPFGREAAAARLYAGTAAVAVTVEAVQIMGGYGYMRDYGMERLLRDAVCTESDYGTGTFSTNPMSRILAE